MSERRGRAWNSTLPARTRGLSRSSLRAVAKPLETPSGWPAGTSRAPREPGFLSRIGRKPIPRVSKKRARENRERSRLKWKLWGGITPPCARPGCPKLADNVHEILPRARSGGVITDPSIWAPLCNQDNEAATRDGENEWAYESGLMFKSWQADEARAAGLVAAWRTEDGNLVQEMPAGGDAA